MEKPTTATQQQMTKHRLDKGGLEQELRRRVNGEVRFSKEDRALYATDGSNYRQVPIGVVVPRSREAAVETMAVCRRYGAPIVSRGGGTALAGQTCNYAVVIDFSKYLNRIIAIDPDRRLARVEPGTILDHLRLRAEKEYQLTFGPDPATHNHCTFGGMIGNNSCGIHSVMAGRTVDNVDALDILTYDGLELTVGATSDQALETIISAGGRRSEIYQGLRQLRDHYGDQIRARYPRIPRRVSGYNLDELLPEKGFNVARALVGSEATCVTVLEATVQLVPSPPGRALLVLGYPDVFQAADHVTEVMAHGPVGLEGIDGLLVNYMEIKGLHVRDLRLLPEGGGWLLVEFGGGDKQEAREKARRVMRLLSKSRNAPAMKLYTDAEEEEQVWEIRESGLGATANIPGKPLTWPGWEDSAIDPSRLGSYLREFQLLLSKYDYEAALYGHFGQGCVHCRITFDLASHTGIAKYLKFIDEAADLVLKHDGSFSGEHGDGQARAALLPKMYGPELMAAFREFKTIWDPEWKMNPGKIIDPFRPEENLRLGTDYRPWQPATHFQFPHDRGSFSRATLRCVGVGKCRRTRNAFMCPSFLVTREERHTTRGRAHLLFEMLRGDLITEGWRSKAVREVLDLCLGCKGCKKECPVDVDMATYKAEFLSHHYAGRLRPPAAYAMGLIGFWAEIGEHIPRLANFFSQTPIFADLMKMIAGIAPERQMPAFAPQTFSSWYRRQRPTGGGKQVLLYPDLFNDCFHPEILAAATEILERWGCEVLLPARRLFAIRPLIHFGMLDLAKRKLQEAITLLIPFADRGIPIVFVEPSTASVYLDELPELFPDDPAGRRITERSRLLSELIVEQDFPLPQLRGKAIFHGHCHQKAVLDIAAARRLLHGMGLDCEEPQPGCCGMAGAFGLEKEHYTISKQIGEEQLLPAVRSAPADTFIIADGFSCRAQIAEGAQRRPLHTAEVIQQALGGNAPRQFSRPKIGRAHV